MVRILRVQFGDHLARLARTGRVLRAHNGNSVSEASAAHFVMPAVTVLAQVFLVGAKRYTTAHVPVVKQCLTRMARFRARLLQGCPCPMTDGFPVPKQPRSTANWSDSPLVPVHRRQALQWNSQRSLEAEHPVQELRETDSQLVRAGIGSCRAGTRTYNKPKVTNVRMPIAV